MNERIEKKISEVIDWQEIRCHTDSIDNYIGKMERHLINYCSDIRYCLEQIEELFRAAEQTASDLLFQEEMAQDLEDEKRRG